MAGLYIHIPYCHAKCAYCDFYSRPDDGRTAEVIAAIIGELHCRRHEIAGEFSTLYIGGGTPSCLSPGLLDQLVEGVRPAVKPDEFTIEVNPEDITAESVAQWHRLGINRVSMGVQSLYDAELRAVGRRHTADDALRAIETINTGGINRISCDLIYGLPGQTLHSWQQSLTRLLATGITHLSAYSLTFEPGTLLYARMMTGKVTPADDETVVQMYRILLSETRRAGMRHYEISNFAVPGCEAVHNSAYWKSVPYLGLGPSAHSFDGSIRRINPSSVKDYLSRVPSFEIDDESPINRINDVIITRLRTADGLDLDNDLPAVYRSEILAEATPWLASGQLVIDGNRLRIPEEGWLLCDSILRDIIISE